MAEGTIQGRMQNSGSLDDFAVGGPALAEDPSRLSSVSGPSLMCYLAVTRATGTMVVTATNGTYHMGFKDGSLITFEQAGVPFLDAVLNQLLGSGMVSAEAASKAQTSARETGRSLLQVLYEQGACTPRDLVEAIRTAKQGALERLMTVPSATWQFARSERAPRATDPVAIDLNLFVVRHVRERTRTAHLVEIEPLLAPLMGRYPVKTERLTPGISGIAFTDKERKTLLEVADGSITLKEVFSLSLLGKNGTARLFVIAGLLGFVEYRLSPLPKGGLEVFEAELKKTLERVQSEDYFTRLGVHWTSHPSKVEPAFRRMVERWGPGSTARRQSDRAAELVDAIFRLMTEAYQVLSDRDKRRAYRLNLLGHAKLEFGTEFLFKQAHLARFRGEVDKAREIIEAALDILPKQEFEEFRRGLGR